MSAAALRDEVETLREENRQLREQLGIDAPDEFLMACNQVFGLARQQARVLSVLVKRERATRAFILSAIETDHAVDYDLNLVGVQTHNLRRRLKRFDIEIETLWGFGYRLSPENRAKVLSLLGLETP